MSTEQGTDVRIDQVGYVPAEEKLGIVLVDDERFDVREAETGDVVMEGTLSAPVEVTNAGERVRHARFDEVRDPGTYVLVTESGARSHPFAIGEGVWGTVLAELCRHYTLQRAGTAIDDPITGLAYDAGHEQDREARLYFADAFHDEGERLDVRGGWYDAGDYGKYVPPAAVTVAQLLLAYEWNPETFTTGQFAMPNGISADDGDVPDLLAEIRFELEWLERMQRPDGGVYHKVAGREWPGFIPPAEDTQPRYVYGLSTYGTAMFAGAMAMGARVFDAFDEDFASGLRANAEAAFDFLDANPEPFFRMDDGQDDGSGPYRKDTDAQERFWAGASLLRTTGDERYAEFLEERVPDQFAAGPEPVSWDNGRLLGQWEYYAADGGTDERTTEIAETILTGADDVVGHVNDEGYNVALERGDYHWASNKVAAAKGCLVLMAGRIDGDEAYRQAAREQIHSLLGRSPTGYAYVTGAGDVSPTDTHDRIDQSRGVTVPGHLVGGPNPEGDDEAMEHYLREADPSPATAYLDVQEAYSVNEPAIDYAAPLVLALADFTPGDAVSPR